MNHDLSLPYYFDEMWRVDMATAADTISRYFTHDTPIALGWLFLCKPFFLISSEPWFAHLLSLIFFELFLLVLFLYLDQFLRLKKWSIASILVIFSVQLYFYYTYRVFSQYSFEMFLYMSLLYFFKRYSQSDHSPRILAFLMLICVLTSVLSIVVNVITPVIFLVLLYKARSLRERIIVGGCFLISMAILLWLMLFFYLPVISPGLKNFWEGGGLFIHQFSCYFCDILRGSLIVKGLGAKGISLLGVVCVILGIRFLYREDKFFVLSNGVVVFAMVVAGLAEKWPFALGIGSGRINMPWSWVLFLTMILGLFSVVHRFCLRRYIEKIVMILVVVLVASWGSFNSLQDQSPSFRNLDKDIEWMIQNSAENSTVCFVSYHFMTHFYTDHYGITTNTKFHASLIREIRNDRSLYKDLNQAIARKKKKFDTIWLLTPWENGSNNNQIIENMTLDTYKKVLSKHGVRVYMAKYEYQGG